MKWSVALVVLLGIALVVGVVLVVRNGQPERVVEQAREPRTEQAAEPRVEANATRTNEEGAVAFEVTPLDLGSSSDTVDFSVSMNTHSVDLGFDLSKMSVLKTDMGVEIAPSSYRGGSGHHVTGNLVFPAERIGGARSLTLIIRDVAGVSERTFTWELK